MGVDWLEIGCLMEVSSMFDMCTYCIFYTLYDRVIRNAQIICNFEYTFYSNLDNSNWMSLLSEDVYAGIDIINYKTKSNKNTHIHVVVLMVTLYLHFPNNY